MCSLINIPPELWVGLILPGWSYAQVVALRRVSSFFARCVPRLFKPYREGPCDSILASDRYDRVVRAWPHDAFLWMAGECFLEEWSLDEQDWEAADLGDRQLRLRRLRRDGMAEMYHFFQTEAWDRLRIAGNATDEQAFMCSIGFWPCDYGDDVTLVHNCCDHWVLLGCGPEWYKRDAALVILIWSRRTQRTETFYLPEGPRQSLVHIPPAQSGSGFS